MLFIIDLDDFQKHGFNWYLDLANERDVRDERYVSAEELKQLRNCVRRLVLPQWDTAEHPRQAASPLV